jgi:UDP-GlcNAc:undecaprenyl-phosphate GlcNAc-1-phosphate transferase
MAEIFGGFFTSLVLVILSIPSIIKVARLKNLIDEPQGRKAHGASTPTLGGIAIFAAFLISLTFWCGPQFFGSLQFVICAAVILFFVGIKDDIYGIVHYKKLMIQIGAAAIIIHWGGIRLTSLYGIFGIHDIPQVASYLLTLVAIVGITNSINFIDGIDCLAGSIGVFITTVFGAWYIYHNFLEWGLLAFSLSGALIGFLYYNRSPAKIFMGDTGALILGLICSVLSIKFIEINKTQGLVKSAPTMAITVMIIPLFDTLRVIVFRLSKRLSPFAPDRNHLHHLLVDTGLTHMQATRVLLLLNLFVVVLALCLENIGPSLGLAGYTAEIILAINFLFLGLVTWGIKRKLPPPVSRTKDLSEESESLASGL